MTCFKSSADKEYVAAKSLTKDSALAAYCKQAIGTLQGATTSGAATAISGSKGSEKKAGAQAAKV